MSKPVRWRQRRVRFATIAAVINVRLVIVMVGVALTCAGASGSAEPRSATGRIEGRVTFVGTPPPPVATDSGEQPTLYLSVSGGLRYAVVYLPDAQVPAGMPAQVATMSQRRFMFDPQVLAIRAGQLVRFTNDDPSNHNVRARDPNPANTFAVSTAAGAVPVAMHRFAAISPERPLELSCDIHPWMVAWIYAFAHAPFAVTDAAGRFHLDDIAPGRYRLKVRQPAGRLQRDLSVDVTPGGTARVEVTFVPADLDRPTR
jgi:plastocyanin